MGPGWWQASDQRWYPPESHPSALAQGTHDHVTPTVAEGTDVPPTQSVWKREIHFRFMEKPLGLAWIMLFESAIALTLVGTGIYQIADPARPAIRAYFSGSPAETITMQFQWLRASEFLVPLLVLGALFLWAGIAIIVAKHQGMAVVGASRAVVTAGCVGQIAVPIVEQPGGMWRPPTLCSLVKYPDGTFCCTPTGYRTYLGSPRYFYWRER